MSAKRLWRIAPPVPFTHDHAGMTGSIVGRDDGTYTLSLRCQPGKEVTVPRSWIVAVDDEPLTAADARARLRERVTST